MGAGLHLQQSNGLNRERNADVFVVARIEVACVRAVRQVFVERIERVDAVAMTNGRACFCRSPKIAPSNRISS